MLKNPQTKLCKAVLINNAFKKLQKPFQFGCESFSWQHLTDNWVSFLSTDDTSVEESDLESNQNIEDITEVSDDSLDSDQNIDVSPYSYNSFLSEVYKAVNNKFNRKLSV